MSSDLMKQMWTGNGLPATRSSSSLSRRGQKVVSAHNQGAVVNAEMALIDTKVRMLKAELRKLETRQMLNNADELINHAEYLAKNNEAKFMVYFEIVMNVIKNETQIFMLEHNALLGR